MIFYFIFLALIFIFSPVHIQNIYARETCAANATNSDIINNLTDPSVYDKWSRPTHDNDEPTNVSVAVRVYFLGSIDVQNLQFTVQIVMSYRWHDPRLEHDSGDLRGEGALRDKVWTPHLYLANEHDSKVMGSGQQDVRVLIENNGSVTCDTRIKATLLCFMDLRKFPFDEQQCPLTLESWSYDTSQLLLKWEENTPVNVKSQTAFVPEYSLYEVFTTKNVSVYSVDGNSYIKDPDSSYHQSRFAGNYSYLTVQFKLKRDYGYYIMDYYVPSILLVVVSWVSFWLDPNAVPGRTTLGTSTMLTFITLSRNIGSSLPKVSYIKSTEIWFIMCTAFIFGSLVEFAFVNTIWRRRKNVELKKKNTKHILKSTLTPQLKRKEMPTIDRSQSFTSLDDTKFSSHFQQKYNSQLTVTSLDSISKDPFPLNNLSEETLSVSVPVPEATPAQKGLFTMTPQEIAQWIDKRSRVVFPLAFIICNMFYWVFIWY